MNRCPKERGPYSFVQGHRRSPGVFLNFFKILVVQRCISELEKIEQLYADVEYSWGTSLYDGDVEDFLRIKTPQWSCGEVLEIQTPLIEDMGCYFRKWREWRNSDLGSKSPTSIK